MNLKYLVGNTHTYTIGTSTTWNTNIWQTNKAANKAHEGMRERKMYYNYT